MALTEEIVLDKIELVMNIGIIQVRNANIIYRDGIEISRTYDRYTLIPGEDTTNEPTIIRNIAATLWTQEVIDKYKQIQAAG